MDKRLTLHTNETFLEMLTAACKAGDRVSLWVDDGGINRVEGLITKMNATKDAGSLELDRTITIAIDQIAAVNGVFRPEYSEC